MSGEKSLAEVFWRNGYRLYAVGGYVRNGLLGLPCSDLDVASRCPLEALEDMARREGFSVAVVNRRLGTCKIRYGSLEAEHTCFRRESYGRGHAPEEAETGVTLREDAFRRDFTVNAIYRDLLTGELIDATGRGLEDLACRRLRTTTKDPWEILGDDGLRLLRMVRFACELNFRIDKGLFACAKANAAKLDEISPERVRDELNRILLSDQKYGIHPMAHRKGLLLLKAAGLLERVVPELKAGRGMAQGSYHRYTVEHHAIMTCAEAPPMLELRLAGLLHDVGKPYVYWETGRFYGHDKRGRELAEQILTRLRYPKALIGTVSSLVAMHMYDLDGRTSEKKIRRFAQRWGRELFSLLPALREADFVGSGYEKRPIATAEKFRRIYRQMEERHVPFSARELEISGEELLAMGYQGREVGQVLEYLLRCCAAKPGDNSRRRLLTLARQARQRGGMFAPQEK